jgi:hypothetical protein
MDVKLYILADYLDVDGLKQQALGNAEHRLHHHFDSHKFIESISIAMESTKSDDTGLRRITMRACILHAGLVKECEKLEQVLQHHEPLA